MVTVELELLPGEANAVAKFLGSKLKSKITIRGKDIQIADAKDDEVKFLIKKFLRREGLVAYRVLTETGIIRIVPEAKEDPIHESRDDKIKGGSTVPSAFVGAIAPNANRLSKLRILPHTSSD